MSKLGLYSSGVGIASVSRSVRRVCALVVCGEVMRVEEESL